MQIKKQNTARLLSAFLYLLFSSIYSCFLLPLTFNLHMAVTCSPSYLAKSLL